MAAIDTAERQWLSHQIDDYLIHIHYFTYGMDILTEITVRSGKVIKATCKPGTMFNALDQSQCNSFESEPARFTVPGLFSMAREWLESFHKLEGSPTDTTPSTLFDETYSYPKKGIWYLPEYSEWNVTLFQKS